MKNLDLSGFTFKFVGYGHYQVIYQTPIRGDWWRALITDMTLIDATKNCECPKVKDIKSLRTIVKRIGAHYSSNGTRID